MIKLHFACNDDNGNHTGIVEAVEIEDVIYLEGEAVSLTLGQHNIINIAGLSFDISGYSRYIGNICWDCATLETAYAATIINYLRTLGWFCTEAESKIFDKFSSGQDITVDDLDREYNVYRL